ncbi:MAG: methionine--tRNA ligase, partial [Patescibacteria group bacterium]
MSKTFYITTSIPYVNGAPHLGNVLDSVYADVLARYHRQKGDDVRFLTGSDEHGTKIQRSAEAAGLTPREFVDKNSAKFKELREVLNLSWDDFIRTSDRERHWPGAQKLWQSLEKSGDLYKKSYKGLYCVGHEAFITDKDLMIGGICQDHQTKPELIEEENWFFKLSKYGKEIGERIKKKELRIVPESRGHEILSVLEDGLRDVSFSRPSKNLSWGVPVPGDDSQTMYVWAEALVNYISALGYGSADESKFQKYWANGDEIVQVIGKDILRFHAAIWPG